MSEIEEFIKFHDLCPALGRRIRKYVAFAFSVTKGINVDAVATQLPPHLMLEVHAAQPTLLKMIYCNLLLPGRICSLGFWCGAGVFAAEPADGEAGVDV